MRSSTYSHLLAISQTQRGFFLPPWRVSAQGPLTFLPLPHLSWEKLFLVTLGLLREWKQLCGLNAPTYGMGRLGLAWAGEEDGFKSFFTLNPYPSPLGPT